MNDDERGAAGPADRAQEGLEHLQAAAREAIQAARAMLDVAEEVVEDPAAVQAAVGALGSMVQAAMARMRPPGGHDGDDDDDGEGDGRVERIDVS